MTRCADACDMNAAAAIMSVDVFMTVIFDMSDCIARNVQKFQNNWGVKCAQQLQKQPASYTAVNRTRSIGDSW